MTENNDTEIPLEAHVQNWRPGDVPRTSPYRLHFETFFRTFLGHFFKTVEIFTD